MEKLTWKTIEHLHTEKTADWYWIVTIVTISIALIAIIMNNIIFAILILVSSFTLSLFASRRPKIVSVLIDKYGITFGETRHPYTELKSFWVETNEHYPKIILKPQKTFAHFIVIYIDDIDPEDVRETLLEFLPEEKHVEPILEKLLFYLGF